MDRKFAPKGPRFGVHPVYVSSGVVASPTANTTTTYMIPVPYRKCVVERLFFGQNVVLVDADGTALATFKKYDAATDADVSLNTAVNIESGVTKETTSVTVDATLTEKQRILFEGDSIRVEVVSNSAAIDTAATGLYFGAELLVLE